MNLLYTLLYGLALCIIFPYEYLKRPKASRKRWVAEKSGNTGRLVNRNSPHIWIHAVSVGEVLAALPLINTLQKDGYTSIVLSTITDTGQQIAREKTSDNVMIIYLPFDMRLFLNRALRILSPDIFMTMETELWPNLLITMKEAGVPVFIFNGRISDRSFPGYKKIKFFLRKLLQAVDVAGMQTEQDADRIRQMGMDKEKIRITGNFKFDIQGTVQAPAWGDRLKGINIIAGSTHEGEEDLIIETYQKLRSDRDNLNLILAPRHPKRFADVEKLLNNKGLDFIKRSAISDSGTEIENVIVMVDTLGELAGLYSIADVCIIGGSFVPVGGHNLFEAAYWSKPIVCGHHMNNFPLSRDFERSNAVRITGKDSLYDILTELLESSELRLIMGRNAYDLFLRNSGGVEKAFTILKPYLDRANNERI